LRKNEETYALLACTHSEAGLPYLRVVLEWREEEEGVEFLNIEHHKMLKLKPTVTQK